MGCAMPEGEQGLNIARLIGAARRPAATRWPAPRSTASAAPPCRRSIWRRVRSQIGAGDVFICAGIESMTPGADDGGFNPMPNPALASACPQAYISMGETAENVARKYKIGRERAGEARRRQPRPRRGGARRPASSTTRSSPITAATRPGRQGRLHPPGHHAGNPRRAEARFRRERHGHRRHLLAADRWRGLRAGGERGICQGPWAEAAGPHQEQSPSPAARRRSWASARWPPRKRR